jgi:methyl-accepting chemotaxis protein PixJ
MQNKSAEISTGIKLFRNRSVATKLNTALAIAATSTVIGIIFVGVVAEQRSWMQIQNQAKSQLAILSKGFRPTTAPITNPLNQLFNQPLNQPSNQPPNQQVFQNFSFRNKPGLIVNKEAIVTFTSGTNSIAIGSKFEPSRLVSKAIALGAQITSIELGAENELAIYNITPTKTEQGILGATIIVEALDTNNSMSGISKALLEFEAIVTAKDLASSQVSSNFPVSISQKALTDTIVQEFKIEGQSYLVSGSPILNYADQPVAAFIHASRYEPSYIFLQVVGLGLVFVIIGYFLALSIINAIIKSIQDTERSAQDYANGNLLAQIDVKSNDEIGVLASLINGMIEKIHKSETDQAGVRAQVQAQNLELEDEVGQLLDIVSDLESGNLTVQAQVTDQATGLVADTLNRLIEQLATIISTVLSTAQQVTQGADSLEQLATSVTQNAQLQSQSVAQATTGIENINQLATTASDEAIAANVAVESAQLAVALGQTEITKLNNSITLLQQGTTQIVQRLKTLGEFVDLAKQFVQDQRRLSSLTQVVAMNASMIAARAVEQKEPDQFASVAREFEAIASQVNNLATQTSQGLVVLQQRTGFIEIVVSGISQDIKDVTNYVTQFTTGVEQSSQAFNDIKDVTGQVAALGQTVFKSSQEIAVAVQSSVESIQEIAALAIG